MEREKLTGFDAWENVLFIKMLAEFGAYDDQPNGETILQLLDYIDDKCDSYNDLHDRYMRERCNRCC